MYQERILNETSSGNASINECLMHVGNLNYLLVVLAKVALVLIMVN
jgi:hypothetical protein